jgi:hypothetical protein
MYSESNITVLSYLFFHPRVFASLHDSFGIRHHRSVRIRVRLVSELKGNACVPPIFELLDVDDTSASFDRVVVVPIRKSRPTVVPLCIQPCYILFHYNDEYVTLLDVNEG